MIPIVDCTNILYIIHVTIIRYRCIITSNIWPLSTIDILSIHGYSSANEIDQTASSRVLTMGGK